MNLPPLKIYRFDGNPYYHTWHVDAQLMKYLDALRRISNIAEQERKRVGSGWWQQVWEIANDNSTGIGVD